MTAVQVCCGKHWMLSLIPTPVGLCLAASFLVWSLGRFFQVGAEAFDILRQYAQKLRSAVSVVFALILANSFNENSKRPIAGAALTSAEKLLWALAPVLLRLCGKLPLKGRPASDRTRGAREMKWLFL